MVTEIAADVRLVVADNPGPMTLDGTNTWVLGPPGGPCVVVDPGPDQTEHLESVLRVAGEVAVTVLTHRHHDHSEGLPRFATLAGTGARAADPVYAIPTAQHDGRLDDGLEFTVGTLRVRVLATPGHTSDSVSLLVTAGEASWLLTGDTVLGRGTSVITHPDGDLAAYLGSLDRLLDVARDSGVTAILPGHGPVVADPAGLLTTYREHRLERLDQVRAALRAGDRTAAEVVARVYADVDRAVWPAAAQSVLAQLDYLRSHP